jgi:HK97 family phage prohead protease
MITNLRKSITAEFGPRLVTLNTGAQGLRAGLTCEAKSVEGEAPCLDFIASDGGVDRYNEVIDPAGWQMDNFRANPVVPDCHDYSSITRILGRAIAVDVQDGRMVNRVQFCLENPLGALAYKMAKAGFIKSQSVGFIPVEWKNGAGKHEPARTYTKQELLEISLVVVPANPAATVGLALKSGAIQKQDLQDVAGLLHTLCNEQADPTPKPGAGGVDVDAARWLQLARELERVLRRA